MPEPVRLVMVVAVAENGVIGRQGGLPWRLSSDLKLFRRLTLGKPLIMGRKTFESIGKPLDGRDNIVVTRSSGFHAPGISVADGIETALRLARDCAQARQAEEIAVIGGAQIYEAALPFTDRIYLTRVHAAPEGDTFFPDLREADWREVSRERFAAGPKDDCDFTLVTLERLRPRESAGAKVV
ncbi:MAG: dihydrofolate reductase [Methyloligellaceae bacterium]